jgi:hypothetical protein
MTRTDGFAAIKIGLLDGPVLIGHSDLTTENIPEVPWKLQGACSQATSTACRHGTLVAGVLNIQALLKQAAERKVWPWVRPLKADLTTLGGPLIRTLKGHSAMVSAVAVTPTALCPIWVGRQDVACLGPEEWPNGRYSQRSL